MPRPRTIAIGAFALLIAATPFIPRGGGEDGALRPSGKQQSFALRTSGTTGYGALTPALRAEVDRVVQQGVSQGRLSGKETTDGLARSLVRCADFEGQTYCLHTGWTESTPAQVQERTAVAARAVAARGEAGTRTGDLDALGALDRAAALSPQARADEERQELTMAARSVAKVWLLRHEIEGVPLPADFLARHPEARATTSAPAPRASASPTKSPSPTATSTPKPTSKTQRDYPRRAVVLSTKQVAEQTRTYWCGPTTMQMITWGWKDKDKGQAHWADLLGTTSQGTGISDMVRVVNGHTGWDRSDHAGPYVVLDIGQWSFSKWMLLTMRHVVDYRAPLVLHPILLKKYYPYLDDDASGHFQVGRGYDKNGDKPTLISYFEPWNQQRFDPSEPYISRVQWRDAYKSYRANEAHFQHNIGV
ncbi:MAG: C39 family peptidase [Nocardioides sp.]